MQKYVCNICGFIYDEATGYPEGGIAPGTKWEDIPRDWVCQLCGATKDEFKQQNHVTSSAPSIQPAIEEVSNTLHELSFEELSVLCSNLSKGCEKQYLTEEAELFNQLADYYIRKSTPASDSQISDLIALIEKDLSSAYDNSNQIAIGASDRGALRALTWGEKVTKILSSLLGRYEKQKDSLLENTNIYVCEICGFVYIGDIAPEICPVCKVPSLKIAQIQRG